MTDAKVLEAKICKGCGRDFSFRKKWKLNWDEVKYCSDECRKNKSRFDFSGPILALLAKRGAGKSICPSEVLDEELKQNRIIMEHVRRSARLLAADGVLEITQNGKRVDPTTVKGPIRLRLLTPTN